MKLAPLWRGFLALALLVSVQGALLHPISHLHAHPHESGEVQAHRATAAGAQEVAHGAAHDDHGTPAHNAAQCDVCVALGALAGYVDAPSHGLTPDIAGGALLASAGTASHLPSPRASFSPRAPPLC